MLDKLRPRSVYDVMAAIACLGTVVGGTAYAANTIGSADIINESILSQDVKNGEVKKADLADDSIGTYKIQPGQVFTSDIHDGVVTGLKVTDNSLRAADIAPDAVGGSELAPAEAWRPVHPRTENPQPGQAYFLGTPEEVEYANRGAPYNPAAYFKDHSGVVHLRGVVMCDAEIILTTCPSSVLQLPANYRPEAVELFTSQAAGMSFDGDDFHEWNGMATVTIDPSGVVQGGYADTGGFFEVDRLSLDGLTFRAAGS